VSLSGEPLVEQIAPEFGEAPKVPMSLIENQRHVLELKDYRARYQAYWNSTSAKTISG
jgi:amidase